MSLIADRVPLTGKQVLIQFGQQRQALYAAALQQETVEILG
jgi:hypothetical protein